MKKTVIKLDIKKEPLKIYLLQCCDHPKIYIYIFLVVLSHIGFYIIMREFVPYISFIGHACAKFVHNFLAVEKYLKLGINESLFTE